ncbi:MAG: hypothetical protein JSR66_20810 [Proteobacteria bacterium]|nr:hypothetical protein [Pseudomonadota bacterium]
MRVLVVGRNAEVLAKAAGTFASDLQLCTAASKADCLVLLANSDFDLIIACETLADGPGLEVLSHVVVNSPNTLRIFAARPATLELLKGELGFFGLFRTLPYPINFRKLWAAIALAQGACDGQAPGALPAAGAVPAPGPLSAALASALQASSAQGSAPLAERHPAPPTSPPPPIRHVVLEDTWELEVLSASQQQEPAPQQHRPTQQQQWPVPQQQPPTPLHEATPGMRAAARYAAAHDVRDAATPPARIPESEAFKRARARRNAANRDAADRNTANSNADKRITDKRDAANRSVSKREPVISNQSLAEIARRFTTQRPFAQLGRLPTGIQRAALFVGSGVFAVITLAVLTFFMAHTDKAAKPAKLPIIASLNQPLPHKAFPWQPETQQPTQQAAPTESEAPPAPTGDLEAQDPAASDTPADRDPAPPDPAPMSPQPPPQAQALESQQAQPVDN